MSGPGGNMMLTILAMLAGLISIAVLLKLTWNREQPIGGLYYIYWPMRGPCTDRQWDAWSRQLTLGADVRSAGKRGHGDGGGVQHRAVVTVAAVCKRCLGSRILDEDIWTVSCAALKFQIIDYQSQILSKKYIIRDSFTAILHKYHCIGCGDLIAALWSVRDCLTQG